MIQFKLSCYKENEAYFKGYTESLKNCFESFLEEYILQARVYAIYMGHKHEGYFAIYDDLFEIEGLRVLTQFVLSKNALKEARNILGKIIKEFNIVSALVYSDDKILLSYAMDFHKAVTMQAYVYHEGEAQVPQAKYPREYFEKVEEERLEEIQSVTNGWCNFLLDPSKKDTYEMYVLEEKGEVLGVGLLESSAIIPDRRSLGIYTIPEHRQKGVARSMMLYLKQICRERGKSPITGCNWYNTKSRATIESAGFISDTRIYRVEFTDEKKWHSI